MAKIIDSEAIKRIPSYSRVVGALGIEGDNHLPARDALAELMTYMDFSHEIRKIKDYVGLFKVSNGKRKIFSGGPRKALEMLTMALKGTTIITAKDQLQTIEKIREAVRREAGGHRHRQQRKTTSRYDGCFNM
ncbi:MAG: hypothetical protein QXR26_05775 [Candidatus Caldarchaeum sp.]